MVRKVFTVGSAIGSVVAGVMYVGLSQNGIRSAAEEGARGCYYFSDLDILTQGALLGAFFLVAFIAGKASGREELQKELDAKS
jgi:hypothetical protein